MKEYVNGAEWKSLHVKNTLRKKPSSREEVLGTVHLRHSFVNTPEKLLEAWKKFKFSFNFAYLFSFMYSFMLLLWVFLNYAFQFLSQVLKNEYNLWGMENFNKHNWTLSAVNRSNVRLGSCRQYTALENNYLAMLLRYLNKVSIILIIITTLTLFGG